MVFFFNLINENQEGVRGEHHNRQTPKNVKNKNRGEKQFCVVLTIFLKFSKFSEFLSDMLRFMFQIMQDEAPHLKLKTK